MSTTILAGIGAALVGALATYLVAIRKLSGKIATSEAGQLWEESRQIRKEYHDQAKDQIVRIQRLEVQVDELRVDTAVCHEENRKLVALVATLEARLEARA